MDTGIENEFDHELGEFLGHDLFTPSPSADSVLTDSSFEFSLDNGGMDQNWLDSLFGDHPVLNDRMISDALHCSNPHVQSEHSYSLSNNEKALDMTVKKELTDIEILGTTVNPNSMIPTSQSIIKIEPMSYNPTSLNSSSNISSTTTNIPTILNRENHETLSGQNCNLSSTTTDPLLLSPSVSTTELTTTSTMNTLNMGGYIKEEPMDSCSVSNMDGIGISSTATHHPHQQQQQQHPTMVTVTRTMNPGQTLLKPTIILATQQPGVHHHHGSSSHHLHNSSHGHTTTIQTTTIGGSHISRQQERLVLPKVNVKMESAYSYSSTASTASSPERISYDQLSLPPTPPSSSNSDSEGCQSPERSQPSSPVRSVSSYQHTTIVHQRRHSSPSPPPCAPFFMNPIPTSGILILSEEEKRTLISEGYPIPNKLPLTKSEEKNLKKIRRKIKNKISAQESRRKKKDYLESLERKVESYSQENVDLKKKMDSLENNNRSLMSQLQKLQSIVNKIRPQNTSQAGTCLMVLVLCFAVFLGTWSPMTWSIGYSSINATPGANYNPLLTSSPAVVGYQHQQSHPDHYLKHQMNNGLGVMQVPTYGGLDTDDSSGSSISNVGGESLSGVVRDSDDVTQGSVNSEHNYYQQGNYGNKAVMGPEINDATSDPYTTKKMKSRVLLSIKEDYDDENEQHQHDIAYGPAPSFCLKDYISKWFNTAQIFPERNLEKERILSNPEIPKVDILDVETEINQTTEGRSIIHNGNNGNEKSIIDQATMHPDLEVVAQTKMDTTA